VLDKQQNMRYNVSNYEEVFSISEKSRAEYFRKRREKLKQFVVMVDKEKFYKLDDKLKSENKTKTEWLNAKIDEEINE